MVTRNIAWVVIYAALLFLALTSTSYAQTPKLINAKEFMRNLKQPATIKKPEQRGFFKPSGTWISTGACLGGAAADIASSLNGYEINPLFRGDNGRLKVGPIVAAKIGVCLLPLAFERKHSKAATVVRFIVAGVQFAVAARNWH